MIRAIIGVLGALTALFPGRIVDAFERVAVANPDEVEPRTGTLPTLRVEGAFVVAIALRGGRVYAWTMYVTGAFGALLLAVPRVYRALAARVLYDDPSAVEWTADFDRILRVVGASYVLLGLGELCRHREGE